MVIVLASFKLYSQKLISGLEAGVGLISLYGNDILNEQHEPNTGFNGGFFMNYKISGLFSVRSCLSFYRKGSANHFEVDYTDANGNIIDHVGYRSSYRFNYVNIPLFLRIQIPDKKRGLFFTGGGYGSYLISSIERLNKTKYNPVIKSVKTAYYNRLDYGVCFGMGFSLPIGVSKLDFELRNSLGLCNISTLEIINNGSIKTNSLNLIISYYLDKRLMINTPPPK